MLQAVRLRGLYQSFAKINEGHPDAGGVIALYKNGNWPTEEDHDFALIFKEEDLRSIAKEMGFDLIKR